MKLIPPTSDPKLLLHSCCAPCSAAIVECMLTNGLRPTLFFYNPNIHPEEEYTKRKEELMRFAKGVGVEAIDGDYDHGEWLAGVKGLERCRERGERCEKCFLLRLKVAAEYAHEHGFSLLATTLASSRWKDIEQVNRAGLLAVEPFEDVAFWAMNWRKGGLQERRATLLKEWGFYNQQYCGCEFSLLSSHNPCKEQEP